MHFRKFLPNQFDYKETLFCTFSGYVTGCIFFFWIYEMNKSSDWRLINSRLSFRNYDKNDPPTDQNKDVFFSFK